MFRSVCAWVIALAIFSPLALPAQDGMVLDHDQAQNALIHKVDPVYPPMAIAAQVTGQVVVKAYIGQDGKVAEATVVSGPPMLRQAAIDAVSQWTYTPFKRNGVATTAVAEVALDFSLANPGPAANGDIAAKYFPAADECHRDMSAAEGNAEAAAKACNLAAAFADMFDPGTRFIERRSAYVFAAAALLRVRRFAEAETMARKGVAVVREGHDDDSGRSAAYAVLGNAEGMLGKLEAADIDMKTAESYERSAIDGPTGEALSTQYRQTLKTILLFHADVLDRMQRPQEAQTKRDEAAKL